jgi:hypothetical protein
VCHMHTVACVQEDHIYCVDCIAQHCSTQLLSMGTVPRCPGSDCSYELPSDEVTAIWSVRTCNKTITATAIAVGGITLHAHEQLNL